MDQEPRVHLTQIGSNSPPYQDTDQIRPLESLLRQIPNSPGTVNGWQGRIWHQDSKTPIGVGSGITCPGSGITTRGIGISSVCHGIRDKVVLDDNKNHKITKYVIQALTGIFKALLLFWDLFSYSISWYFTSFWINKGVVLSSDAIVDNVFGIWLTNSRPTKWMHCLIKLKIWVEPVLLEKRKYTMSCFGQQQSWLTLDD